MTMVQLFTPCPHCGSKFTGSDEYGDRGCLFCGWRERPAKLLELGVDSPAMKRGKRAPRHGGQALR